MNAYRQECEQRGWAVPEFRVDAFFPRRKRYAVLIPVINEGERIRAQLRNMQSLSLPNLADVIIVDGGSTDSSLALDFLREASVRALLTKTGPGKLSAQLRCGYAWALLEGYAGIVTIDGNGKDGVETIPNFLEALDKGFGYVQASRFLRGGHSANTPLLRLLAIRLLHAPLLSLAAGVWLTDTTQGYRAYSRAYLLDSRVQPFREAFIKYELLAYLSVRASQIGYWTKELPTSRIYPRNEKIPTKISGFAALAELMGVVFRTVAREFHPRTKA